MNTRAEHDVQALMNLTCRRPVGSSGKSVPVSLEAGQGVVNAQEFGTLFSRMLQERDTTIRVLQEEIRKKDQAHAAAVGEFVQLLAGENRGKTLKQWKAELASLVVRLSKPGV